MKTLKFYLKFYFFITFFLLQSCEKDTIEIDSKMETSANAKSMLAIEKLANLVASNFDFVSTSTPLTEETRSAYAVKTESRTIKSITPIYMERTGITRTRELSDLVVVNYARDEGYLIVDISSNKFPVVSFSDEGNFVFDQLDSTKKAEFIQQYDLYASEKQENSALWSDINEYLNNPETDGEGTPLNKVDSLCVTDIQILPQNIEEEKIDNEDIKDDKYIISEDIPHEFVFTRSIANRTLPKNREYMYPVVGYLGLKWHGGEPYKIEMPYEYGGNHISVPKITIALSKLMCYYRRPIKYDWLHMPREVTTNTKSAVSSLFRDVSNSIGCIKTNLMTYNLTSNKIQSIPNILENTFNYTDGGELIRYKNDEKTFLEVYNSLLKRHAVLFCSIPQTASLNSSHNIVDAWIVDGYEEMRVKVVKKWYFVGICYKKRTYYYYRDYFHYISSSHMYSKKKGDYYNGNYDGWFRYDYKTNNRSKHYAIVNIKPLP